MGTGILILVTVAGFIGIAGILRYYLKLIVDTLLVIEEDSRLMAQDSSVICGRLKENKEHVYDILTGVRNNTIHLSNIATHLKHIDSDVKDMEGAVDNIDTNISTYLQDKEDDKYSDIQTTTVTWNKEGNREVKHGDRPTQL